MKFVILLALVALAFGKEIGVRNFNGYQVFTVTASTRGHVEALRSLSEEFDFWTEPNGLGDIDVMAAPEQIPTLLKVLQKNGMKYQVKFENVEKMVQEERAANAAAKAKGTGRIDWTSYATYAEITEFFTSINAAHATTFSIGNSTQGRAIHGVRFHNGGGRKKALLIDSNIHAREWIAGATGTWIVNELIRNHANYTSILEQVDIFVIPMLNPDGYEFSRTSDRMWRKTRSANPGSTCIGCDPNRNFGFHWGGESTSPNPCSDTFHGPRAFSEPETAALRDWVNAQETAGTRFVAYFTLHSYANMWLLPWGYTSGVYPPDYDQQLSLGRAGIAALQAVHGTRYTTGQGADLLYGVGGASDDWAKDHGIKYTSTVEMRGNSFVLPPAQIIPNSEEVWAGLKVVLQRIIETP